MASQKDVHSDRLIYKFALKETRRERVNGAFFGEGLSEFYFAGGNPFYSSSFPTSQTETALLRRLFESASNADCLSSSIDIRPHRPSTNTIRSKVGISRKQIIIIMQPYIVTISSEKLFNSTCLSSGKSLRSIGQSAFIVSLKNKVSVKRACMEK